jgi:hypothetical protein
MRLDVVAGEFARRRQQVEPPGAPSFGAGFGTVQQIALADHADHMPVAVDDR